MDRVFPLFLTLVIIECSVCVETTPESCTVGCQLRDNLPCTMNEEPMCANLGTANPDYWPRECEVTVEVYMQYNEKEYRCQPLLNISWTPPNDASRKHITGFYIKQKSLGGNNVNVEACLYFDMSAANWTAQNMRDSLVYQYQCLPMLSRKIWLVVYSLPMSPMDQAPNYVVIKNIVAPDVYTVNGDCKPATTHSPSKSATRAPTKHKLRTSIGLQPTTKVPVTNPKPVTDQKHRDHVSPGENPWTPTWLFMIIALGAVILALLVFAAVMLTRKCQHLKKTNFQPLNNECLPVEQNEGSSASRSNDSRNQNGDILPFNDDESIVTNTTFDIEALNSNYDSY